MALVLTKFAAYGVEASEPIFKRYIQRAVFSITAANTDATIDLGNFSGTFWTAVVGTATGAAALTALQDIVTKVEAAYNNVQSSELETRANVNEAVRTLTSAASGGGSASEVYTVTGLKTTDTIIAVTPLVASATGRPTITAITGTIAGGSATPTATVAGLLTTDTILGVSQSTINANSLPLLGYNTQAAGSLKTVYSGDPGANGIITVAISRVATTDTFTPVSWGTQASNALTVTYGANPGAGAKVIVSFLRKGAAVDAGQYSITTQNSCPNIAFNSGDAPTAYDLVVEWTLQDASVPTELYKP